MGTTRGCDGTCLQARHAGPREFGRGAKTGGVFFHAFPYFPHPLTPRELHRLLSPPFSLSLFPSRLKSKTSNRVLPRSNSIYLAQLDPSAASLRFCYLSFFINLAFPGVWNPNLYIKTKLLVLKINRRIM